MPETITSNSFTLDPNRLAKATYWPLVKPRIRPFILLILLIGFTLIFGFKANPLLVIGILVVVPPFAILNAFNRYASHLRKTSNKLLFLPKSVSISSEEFKQEANDGSVSVVKLPSIIKVDQMGEFTVLYISSEMAFFVPQSAWKSEEDADRFQALVHHAVKR